MNYLNELLKDTLRQTVQEKIDNIKSLIKSMNKTSITMYERHIYFPSLNKLVYKLDPEKYNKHRAPYYKDSVYQLEDNIEYIIVKKNVIILVKTYTELINDVTEGFISVSFYGKMKYKFKNKILKQIKKSNNDDKIRIDFGVMSNSVESHTFDNMILKDSVKNHIINGLNRWKNDGEWYKQHQMVHKIGILLYGKPGTGKSTIAKSISNMFNNAPILSVNGSDVSCSLSSILNFRKIYNDNVVIILIEDLDMFFNNRDSKVHNNGDLNQNILFQILDGVYSTDNTIYIATTNYIDKIDSALIRYGRFDIQEELTYFNKEEAIKAVELFGYDESILDQFDLEYPVQPAYLQSKILEYRTINSK